MRALAWYAASRENPRDRLAGSSSAIAIEVQPDDYEAPFLFSQALETLDRMEEGEAFARIGLKRAEEALRRHPESSRPAQLGACTLATLGEAENAERWMERALAIDPEDSHIKYNAACMWAQLGDVDRALDLLQIWANHVGPEIKDWMLRDPDLDSIRDHPRYPELLKLIDASIAERTNSEV